MNDLIAALVKAGAPILGTVIGGPAGSLAGAAIGALADALGTASTPEAVKTAIDTQPGAAAIVKQVEADRGPALWESYLKDVQDARATTVKLVEAGSSIAWGAPVVSVLVTLLFAAVVILMLTKPISFTDVQGTILNILVGILGGAFSQVVNYWLRMLADSGASEEANAAVFATIGAMRAVALFANGKLPVYGPLMRYAGSLVGAFVWAMLMSPLILDSLLSGKVSIFVPLLGMLTLGELISVYRAVRDGGFRRR